VSATPRPGEGERPEQGGDQHNPNHEIAQPLADWEDDLLRRLRPPIRWLT